MPEIINTEQFLEMAKEFPIVDVRSPLEFNHASYPNAISFPLMNDEERAIIGTTFKKEGRSAAVLKGYALIGPKFSEYLKEAIKMFPQKKVVMYCWRGGLRSNIMAFLFETADIKVMLLKGGYKMFRNKVLNLLEYPMPIVILGGMTGSGKTKILKELSNQGECVIDLEGLAKHKGSAFGGLGELPQPSNEHFENLLALEILASIGKERVWFENESRMIGRIKIPDIIYQRMREAKVIELILPVEERIKEIETNYCNFPQEELIECTQKLKKKLGDLRTTQACDALAAGNSEFWIRTLLEYYDENYFYSSSLRNPESVSYHSFQKIDEVKIAETLLKAINV